MAFFGKNFKKFKFENIEEFFEAHKVPEKTRLLFTNTDSITRYEKNADGTVQYISTKDGEVKWNQKIEPNTETEFTTPDGIPAKIITQVNGDSISSVLSFPDGSKLHLDRVYENNILKQTIYKDNDSQKATIYYEAV